MFYKGLDWLVIQLISSVWASWVPSSVNLALNKPARQSTTKTGSAHLVVNGVFSDFSETKAGNSKWWAVNLEEIYEIGQIKVYSDDQLLELTILTTEEPSPDKPSPTSITWARNHYKHRAAVKVEIVNFASAVAARHVAVHSGNNKSLTLSEVEVFGYPAVNNLAWHKRATQKNGVEHPAQQAINGDYEDFTLAEGRHSWWKVDLGSIHLLFVVILHNRRDCCQNFLDGYKIYHHTVKQNTKPWSQWERLVNNGQPFQRVKVFGAERTFRARHVGISLAQNLALSLAEVEIFGPYNLAYQKPTDQRLAAPEHPPSKAVNSISDDFITLNPLQRWKVDLGDVFVISRLEVINVKRRSQTWTHLHMYSSKQPHSMDVTTNLTEWNKLEEEEVLFYGEGVEWTYAPIEARHVLLDNTGATLYLAEVIIGEFDYASGKLAEQSSTCTPSDASSGLGTEPCDAQRAVDNRLDTYSATDDSVPFEQWWKVYLGKLVMFRLAVVYGSRRTNCFSWMKESQPCLKKLGTLRIETGRSQSSTICYQGHDDYEEAFIVQCNRNLAHPIMSYLAIFMTISDNYLNLELGQVEVYARELPQLKGSRQVIVTETSPFQVNFTFLKWSYKYGGYLPPTSYVIQLNRNLVKIVKHDPNPNVDRISVSWENLRPGETYHGKISCRIAHVNCIGVVDTFRLTTSHLPNTTTFLLEKLTFVPISTSTESGDEVDSTIVKRITEAATTTEKKASNQGFNIALGLTSGLLAVAMAGGAVYLLHRIKSSRKKIVPRYSGEMKSKQINTQAIKLPNPPATLECVQTASVVPNSVEKRRKKKKKKKDTAL